MGTLHDSRATSSHSPWERLEDEIGIKFHQRDLLVLAFTHRSYLNEDRRVKEHNERLEFLGDALIESIVTEYLYHAFPHVPEGQMTVMRSSLVRGAALAELALALRFDEYLKLSYGERLGGGRAKSRLLANTFEAVVAAIHLGSSPRNAKRFVESTVLTQLWYLLEEGPLNDPFSRLQEISQEDYGLTPQTVVLGESGADHNKQYEVGVYLGETQVGTAVGTSKKDAKLAAAADALQRHIEWEPLLRHKKLEKEAVVERKNGNRGLRSTSA